MRTLKIAMATLCFGLLVAGTVWADGDDDRARELHAKAIKLRKQANAAHNAMVKALQAAARDEEAVERDRNEAAALDREAAKLMREDKDHARARWLRHVAHMRFEKAEADEATAQRDHDAAERKEKAANAQLKAAHDMREAAANEGGSDKERDEGEADAIEEQAKADIDKAQKDEEAAAARIDDARKQQAMARKDLEAAAEILGKDDDD